MASNPVEIFSSDPEVMALQAMIKGLRHFGANPNLTMRHFKVLAGVELHLKVTKRPPTMEEIEPLVRLKIKDFQQEVHDLLVFRYLVEEFNVFGQMKMRYKLGPVGGTAIRTMFKHLQPVALSKEPLFG